MERGIYMAFTALTLWGIMGVGQRYASVELHADPVLFACLELFISAVAMLAIAGPGRNGMKTLSHPLTWGIGISRVLIAIFFMIAVSTLSASEVYFLLRIYVVLGIGAAWVIFHRKPSKPDSIGIAIVLLGLSMVAIKVGLPFWHPAVLSTIAVAVLETAVVIFAELHPVSNKTIGVRARCRYTGVVLLVTSLLFILFTLGLSVFAKNTFYTPDFSNIFQPSVWILAILIGVFLRAPAMYFHLLASRLAKSENVLMAATVGPFIVLGLESILDFTGVLPMPSFGMQEILGGCIITIGSIGIIANRLHKHGKNK